MPRKVFTIRKNPPLRARHDSAGSTGSRSSYASTQKFEKSEQGGSSSCNFRYGATAMQGFRPHMQDDFSCVPTCQIKGEPLGFFAVFDGHGHHGELVSQYCTDNFANSLLSRKAVRNARSITCDVLKAGLRKTFLKFDAQLSEAALSYRPSAPDQNKVSFGFSGTTATTALVLKNSLIVANVGDSRTLLCRSGSLHFSTTDHNPGNKTEDDRILAAGGKIHTTPSKHKVILDPEAYTNLAVSRTLGDFGFKRAAKLPIEEQVVTPVPDITEIARDHRTDEFLLLASDGIFKALSNEEVVEFVKRQLTITDDLTRICYRLIEMAYYSPGNSPDDTTVVLVVFPSAPSPTPKAIQEEESIEAECLEAIKDEIEKLVRAAEGEWALENEFSIIQKLARILPKKYCVQLRNKFILRTLSNAKEDRFGVKDLEQLKEGGQDETDATTDDPENLNVYTPGETSTSDLAGDLKEMPDSACATEAISSASDDARENCIAVSNSGGEGDGVSKNCKDSGDCDKVSGEITVTTQLQVEANEGDALDCND